MQARARAHTYTCECAYTACMHLLSQMLHSHRKHCAEWATLHAACSLHRAPFMCPNHPLWHPPAAAAAAAERLQLAGRGEGGWAPNGTWTYAAHHTCQCSSRTSCTQQWLWHGIRTHRRMLHPERRGPTRLRQRTVQSRLGAPAPRPRL